MALESIGYILYVGLGFMVLSFLLFASGLTKKETAKVRKQYAEFEDEYEDVEDEEEDVEPVKKKKSLFSLGLKRKKKKNEYEYEENEEEEEYENWDEEYEEEDEEYDYESHRTRIEKMKRGFEEYRTVKNNDKGMLEDEKTEDEEPEYDFIQTAFDRKKNRFNQKEEIDDFIIGDGEDEDDAGLLTEEDDWKGAEKNGTAKRKIRIKQYQEDESDEELENEMLERIQIYKNRYKHIKNDEFDDE